MVKQIIREFTGVPSVKDLLDACEQTGIDPERAKIDTSMYFDQVEGIELWYDDGIQPPSILTLDQVAAIRERKRARAANRPPDIDLENPSW